MRNEKVAALLSFNCLDMFRHHVKCILKLNIASRCEKALLLYNWAYLDSLQMPHYAPFKTGDVQCSIFRFPSLRDVLRLSQTFESQIWFHVLIFVKLFNYGWARICTACMNLFKHVYIDGLPAQGPPGDHKYAKHAETQKWPQRDTNLLKWEIKQINNKRHKMTPQFYVREAQRPQMTLLFSVSFNLWFFFVCDQGPVS